MNVTTRFTEQVVSLAESYCDDADEPAAPNGGGRFTDHATISLHCLRIFLEKSYVMTLDLLATMTPIL
ncbi:IS5/IS1182 family transposase, partial [Halobacteriales archaeon QH_9_66_26]